MSADRNGRGGGRTDGSDRLALWLHRLRWLVLLGWVVLVVLVSPTASGLTNALDNGVQAFLPSGAASTRLMR